MDVALPSKLTHKFRGVKKLQRLVCADYLADIRHDEQAFVVVNDEVENDAKRETKLLKMFAENGIRVSFYGKYPKVRLL